MKKLCTLLAVLLVFSMFSSTAYAAEEKVQNFRLGDSINFTSNRGNTKNFKIVLLESGKLTVDLSTDADMIWFSVHNANGGKIKATGGSVLLGSHVSGDKDNSYIGQHPIEKKIVISYVYGPLEKGIYYIRIQNYSTIYGTDSADFTLAVSSNDKSTSSKPTGDPKVSIAVPLKKGQSFQLGTALSNTGSKQPAWKSSDKTIASVSSKGLVKAIKKGTATITVTVAGKKHSIAVVVSD